jgi:hypothetical protein
MFLVGFSILIAVCYSVLSLCFINASLSAFSRFYRANSLIFLHVQQTAIPDPSMA